MVINKKKKEKYMVKGNYNDSVCKNIEKQTGYKKRE